ncbi:MAG: SusD/RagB family nutrient-binding outer membrane lipoprotein [Bacteroidia bacterium]
MKTNKIFVSAIAVTAMLLFATSCSKDFYTKVNNNPNQPTVVPPKTLLPGIEVSLAYAQGGNAWEYAGCFTQQGYGWNREATAFYTYDITGSNLPEALWDNMYSSVMNNDYALLNMATSNGYNEYAGIANILMAYSLQVTVDFWGNVPYSQAFKGSADIEPTYDADATLYGNIITLLNTGISDLKLSPGGLVPTTDDVIYGGNAASWIAFANAIKARIYIHQTKINAALAINAYAAADSALTEGFTTAQVVFPGPPNSSPVNQYNTAWGDITYVTNAGFHCTLFDTMTALTDPRITVYFDTAGAAEAITSPIVGMDATTYYGNSTSPVEFITKEELDFIEAEATLKGANTGTVAAASICYANAINDNFTKLGISAAATAYVIANPLPVSIAGAEYTLGKQEWIALFMNPESWVTWRRTGAPALQPVTAGDAIPRRMVLPNSEITENSSAPQGETLWTPQIFWDK